MTTIAFPSPQSHAPGAAASQDLPARLHALAASQPGRLALLHKEYGHWRGYRWQDVFADVIELIGSLQARGLGAGDRFAVCGSFEPKQLLLALAALQLGAQVLSIPRGLSAEALQHKLGPLGLRHAYVQGRQDIAAWAASPALARADGHLFTARGSVVAAGRWHSEAVAALQTHTERVPLRWPLRAALKSSPSGWAQEGSDWAGGLETVLRHWVEQGLVLALPETQATASRDRIEIQPTQLLLSDAARQQVAAELRQRVPHGAGWRARLGAALVAQALQQSGPQGLLQRRVARLQGLRRLAQPLLTALTPASRPAPADAGSLGLARSAA